MPVEFVVRKERIEKLFKSKSDNIVYLLDGNKFVVVPRVYSRSWILEDNGTMVIRGLTMEEFKEIIERIKEEE